MSSFKITLLIHKMLVTRSYQHLTKEDFDGWIYLLLHDKSRGDDELAYEMWQEALAEIKDAFYQVVH